MDGLPISSQRMRELRGQGKYNYLPDDLAIAHRGRRKLTTQGVIACSDAEATSISVLCVNNSIQTGDFLVKTAGFFEAGGYPEHGLAEDWRLYLRLALSQS